MFITDECSDFFDSCADELNNHHPTAAKTQPQINKENTKFRQEKKTIVEGQTIYRLRRAE
jgi:hypothetical protein